MTSGRKRPQCHQCGTMMRGHTRGGRGKFICPGSSLSFDSSIPEKSCASSGASVAESVTPRCHSYATPLPSPPVSPSPTPASPPAYTATFTPPPGNSWHWKNPNWRTPPRNTGEASPVLSARPSLAPTEPNTEYQASIQDDSGSMFHVPKKEPVDDDHIPWEEENDDQGSTYSEYFGEFRPAPLGSVAPRSWSPCSSETDESLNGVLRGSTPLFKVFRTRHKDICRVTHAAEEVGKHVCVIDAPSHYPGTSKLPMEKAHGTVWVLVSDREDDLKYAVDSQQRGMPGTLLPDQQTVQNGGFLEMVFAGLVGAILVACGFKFL
ncbi:hypothetical protein ID866_2605 [Astraeus odoratus]|nr:hypothetical protein ID866_2605 [Astraeus odoratus]